MDMLSILDKKRTKQELSDEEIRYFVEGYTNNSIPDYQASALLMAICINGLNKRETLTLTDAMLHSGDVVDLSAINGIKVDKHSSGGVSDTTSIALVPILASLGLKVAKMSGPGLGFTGGTTDKLTVFKDINLRLSKEEIIDTVNKVGGVIVAQSQGLVPADKKLYALRDITSTVQSIPLIASSIMSKKIAAGNDVILLDVKTGEGAFMEKEEDAIALAKEMIDIGKGYGKKISAVISDMNQPLGDSIGCRLEVEDAVNVLQGKQGRLYDMVKFLATHILESALSIDLKEAEKRFNDVISSGAAYNKLKEIVIALNGKTDVLDHFNDYKPSFTINAEKTGMITNIAAKELGLLVCDMGGGRKELTDIIDLDVGIRLKVKVGSMVNEGDILCEVYNNNKLSQEVLTEKINSYITIDKPTEVDTSLVKAYLK